MINQLQFMMDKHPDIIKGEPPYIVVKFNKKLKLTYEKPIIEQLKSKNFDGWEKLEKRYPGAEIVAHFTAVSPKELNSWVEKAQKLDETYRPTDFFSYFRIEHKDPFKLLEIEKEIKSWKEFIDTAYLYVPAPSPAVNPGNDPRSTNQGYLDVAPGGIDARYAWTFVGGDGAGIQLVDIERGWTFNHEDLTAHGITHIHGNILDSDRFHGTSVLGELCAVDNTIGCVGIAPHLALVRGSSFHDSTQSDSILAAIGILKFGDAILLEAQNWVPEISMMLGPIELTDDVFETIRLATALGMIVVEAGGNGTDNGSTPPFDLDAYINSAGNAIFNPLAATFRDSGAIIVTAATSAAPHTRLAYGPHGRRIDCYAWGQNINTLNSNAASATNLYTTSFSGTSGASPIITGAALLVQGIAEASLGFRFSPRQMRAILRDPANGTPRAATETTRINVMPNLRLIIDNVLGIVPDIYIRDFVGDVGAPHTGAISASPDIIVRSTPVVNPQTSFGEGSGTENSATLGSTVTNGVAHSIYARVRNRGGAAANNVTATIYWSPVASLVTPNLWNLIGTTPSFNVPTGDQLTVSPALNWPAGSVPASGHYCFVGLIDHALDPAPLRAYFENWTNFQLYIRNNNNVTWRNFNVVPAAPSPSANPAEYLDLRFLLVGAGDKARPFDVAIDARLPEGAKLQFEFPAELQKQLKRLFPDARYQLETKSYKAVLSPHSPIRMKALKLSAKFQGQCRILVYIPKEARKKTYNVRLSQFFKETQVGGITWQIGGKEQ
ncbi:MAG: S8 family serine peptidase [Saprospiraceae bacterium]|nr:S8 family serine peptidase [Saprospiraceae bacterium]